MTNDEASTQDMPGGRVAFRLTAETPVYESADSASVIEELLPGGAMIVVDGPAGDFLRIVTRSDNFGYIPASTAMAPAAGLVMAVPESSQIEESSGPVLSPSQRRDGLIFLSQMEREAEDLEGRRRQGIDPPGPADNAGIGLLLPIALGMIGILVTHIVSGLMTWELALLFIFDVLFPLFMLPLGARGSWTTLPFYVFLAGYLLVTDVAIPQ